jgi:hypothetical protein
VYCILTRSSRLQSCVNAASIPAPWLRSHVFHKVQKYTAASCGFYSLFGSMRNSPFMPPRSRPDENEVEVLRELLNCIESALKALEKSDKKKEPRLKTVRVNLQVSRNMVRHFLSVLGAPYPPP